MGSDWIDRDNDMLLKRHDDVLRTFLTGNDVVRYLTNYAQKKSRNPSQLRL